MNRLRPARVIRFVVILTVIALVINGRRSPFAEAVAPQPARIVSPSAAQPPDLTVGYSSQAQQAIAGDIAQTDQAQFGRIFSVRCLSITQSERKFNGYGINTDMVIVSARFRISALAGRTFSKDFKISVTIEAPQFQGLSNDDTIQRIVNDLEKQIQTDPQTLSTLHQESKP